MPKEAATLYLKWTSHGRTPLYQGGDPIPYRLWTDQVSDPILCGRGWHACRWGDAIYHIAAELWVCELDGTIVEGADKVAGERLRIIRKVPLSDRDLRLFAADCAETVLPIFEDKRPGDDRPRLAIKAAREYAHGNITQPARAAAWDAAWAAAWAAAESAGAAEGAAWAAARDAAWAAEGAARVAARDAARAAAWAAARVAAEGAARVAAWDAAWAAAEGAARADQTDRLLVKYGGLDPTHFAHRKELV